MEIHDIQKNNPQVLKIGGGKVVGEGIFFNFKN